MRLYKILLTLAVEVPIQYNGKSIWKKHNTILQTIDTKYDKVWCGKCVCLHRHEKEHVKKKLVHLRQSRTTYLLRYYCTVNSTNVSYFVEMTLYNIGLLVLLVYIIFHRTWVLFTFLRKSQRWIELNWMEKTKFKWIFVSFFFVLFLGLSTLIEIYEVNFTMKTVENQIQCKMNEENVEKEERKTSKNRQS